MAILKDFYASIDSNDNNCYNLERKNGPLAQRLERAPYKS